GFLRSERSLIQTIGRAARHVNGQAILYADILTESMQKAIQETRRRRQKQLAYNQAHGLTPQPIRRKPANRILQTLEFSRRVQAKETPATYQATPMAAADISAHIQELEQKMREAARRLEFEQAARYRDQIQQLKQHLAAP
ncbi:MAG: UvrB/UvrC motif-containing protein, partial [Gloeomargarita sp. SZTDM-1c_bins_89]